MSREALEQLIDRWTNDPDFREEMRRNPDAAVERAGLQLDEAEWTVLRQTDWTRPDDELRARMTDVIG